MTLLGSSTAAAWACEAARVSPARGVRAGGGPRADEVQPGAFRPIVVAAPWPGSTRRWSSSSASRVSDSTIWPGDPPGRSTRPQPLGNSVSPLNSRPSSADRRQTDALACAPGVWSRSCGLGPDSTSTSVDGGPRVRTSVQPRRVRARSSYGERRARAATRRSVHRGSSQPGSSDVEPMLGPATPPGRGRPRPAAAGNRCRRWSSRPSSAARRHTSPRCGTSVWSTRSADLAEPDLAALGELDRRHRRRDLERRPQRLRVGEPVRVERVDGDRGAGVRRHLGVGADVVPVAVTCSTMSFSVQPRSSSAPRRSTRGTGSPCRSRSPRGCAGSAERRRRWSAAGR